MRMQHKILVGLTCITITGMFFLGYFLFLDGTTFHKAIEISSISVSETSYRPGQLVTAYVSYCEYRSVPFTLEWTLLDERKVFYVADENQLWPMGCFTNMPITIKKLPPTLPIDSYEFSGEITVPTNGIRNVDINFKTNQFFVK